MTGHPSLVLHHQTSQEDSAAGQNLLGIHKIANMRNDF